MSRDQIVRLAGFVCYSPLFYGAIAYFIGGGGPNGVDARVLIDWGLAGAFFLLVVSRIVVRVLLPGEGMVGVGRVAGVCMLVAGLGESISAGGAVVAWLGVPLVNCVPFFVIGLLYTLEFRFFRLPVLLGRIEDVEK